MPSDVVTPAAAAAAAAAANAVTVEKPAFAGHPWTEEETVKLLAAVQEKTPFHDIAKTHQRTVGGVVAHLKKIAYNALTTENMSMEAVVTLTGLTEAQVQKAVDVRDPVKKVAKKSPVRTDNSVQDQLAEIKALLVQVLAAVKA